jgi:fatty acid amide hydrolase
MARSVEDLALWMKTTLDVKYHSNPDPFHRLISFDTEVYKKHSKKKLRIGLIKSHSFLEASPASQRAVDEVGAYLRDQGHETVPVEIPNFDDIVEEFMLWYSAEGKFQAIGQMLAGEEPIPSYKLNKSILQSKILGCIARTVSKFMSPRLHLVARNIKEVTVAEYCSHKSQLAKMRMDFCAWWKQQGLDHIVTAGLGCQPNLNHLSGDLFLAIVYTFIWNTLNMPAGALPITTVR